jgi:RNA recognition motif. (a.k.a. RRM, RBD, or RNP domain)
MATLNADSLHSLISGDKIVDNIMTAIDLRFVAVGVHRSVPIQNLYKYFSQFGEVKFCVVIPPSLQLNQLGDLHQSCLESLVVDDQNHYNALVEVSITQGFLKMPKVQTLKKQSFVCLTLTNPTKTSDDLIQTVKDRKLFVYGLKKSINEDTLCQIFKVYGKVEYARIIRNLLDQRSKGFGFVVFKYPASRLAALADGHMYYKDKLIRWTAFKTIMREPVLNSANTSLPGSAGLAAEIHNGLDDNSTASIDPDMLIPSWKRRSECCAQLGGDSDPNMMPNFPACKKYRFNKSKVQGSYACKSYESGNWRSINSGYGFKNSQF